MQTISVIKLTHEKALQATYTKYNHHRSGSELNRRFIIQPRGFAQCFAKLQLTHKRGDKHSCIKNRQLRSVANSRARHRLITLALYECSKDNNDKNLLVHKNAKQSSILINDNQLLLRKDEPRTCNANLVLLPTLIKRLILKLNSLKRYPQIIVQTRPFIKLV